MNSVRTLVVRIFQLVLPIVLLTAAFAAAFNHDCPPDEYLDPNTRFPVCIRCSSCHVPNDVIIRPCRGRNNTVCGSISDLESGRMKKMQPSPKKKNQKKLASTESSTALFENDSSFRAMLTGLNHGAKKSKDAARFDTDARVKQIDDFIKKNNNIVSPRVKSFDKNGKHMKKDLSSVDETSKTSVITTETSLHKKTPSKSKKVKNEPLNDDKWRPIVVPDFVNHRINVVEEPMLPREIIPIDFDKKSSDNRRIVSAKSAEDQDIDTIEYSADSNEDDNDEDEDEDDDDEDDDDDENDASEEDEDSDTSFPVEKTETIGKPFGVDDTLSSMQDVDDDDDDDSETHDKYEVNVEPYLDSSNWQLLILVGAVTACLLFFLVLTAYICIYNKRWKHMKHDFEADVEDLSVRINLMQHAGFEAEETTNMRNYIAQLKGGKFSTEKVPKSTH